MKNTVLDDRLLSAAGFVRQGAVFADIGTDHAYLPLFLLARGVIRHAVCADIGEGPLEKARQHAAATPYLHAITFLRTDGLAGMESLGLTDIAICGMGGELIAKILEHSPLPPSPHRRYILQPMSRPAHLRRYLWSNGYTIEAERYAKADGKLYVCLCATHGTGPETHTPFEEEFGCFATASDPLCLAYARRRLTILRRIAAGKRAGGETAAEENALIEELLRFLATHDS